MQSERRQSERLVFHMNECRGMFTIDSGGDEYEIETINDISLSGIGFDLPVFLEVECPVSISYHEEGIEVSVCGLIVWCREHPSCPGLFHFGMRFDYEQRDESSRLLLALQCYTGAPEDDSF